MQCKKLARMAVVPGLALTMPATPGISEAAAPAAPASHTAVVKQADAPTVTVAGPRRPSKRCTRPRNKRFNVSYTRGRTSTTFYFNNHCSHKSYIKIKVRVPATGMVTNSAVALSAEEGR